MKIPKKTAATVSAGAVSLLALAACSHIQPSIAQYAIVTGHGNFSNQQVLDVVQPGDNVHIGSGTTTWYVWANTRNYVTATSNGDRNDPQAELTGPGPSGAPGMSDYTWTYVTWEINPAIVTKTNGQFPVATDFLAFCLKYGCADQNAQNDDSNAALARSSSPGWEAMLNEVMPRAIDNATRDAIVSYQPNLWTERGEWDAYGDAISSHLLAEISQLDGSAVPFFCGPGSTTAKCTAPNVIVQNVTPSDTAVITAYNQQVAAQYAAQAGTARLNAAKEIYGSDANYFLGLEDLVNDCGQQHISCNIYVGNPPVAANGGGS
jgi:hypothetical protein